MGPFPLLARRHDVGMAGEDQMGAGAADAGIEVFNRRGTGLGEGDAMDLEARRLQRALDHAECTALRGRHRRAADKVAGERDGIGIGELMVAALSVPRDRVNAQCLRRQGQRVGAVTVGSDRPAQTAELDEGPDRDGEADRDAG